MSTHRPNDPLERLSTLVRARRGELCSVARSEGLDAEEALECVQDALCTHLGRDPLPPDADEAAPHEDHTLASLKVTVRNAARNFRRLHRRSRAHDPIEDADRGELSPETAEALLSHAEDVVRLRACVAELCGVQRAVVLLRLLEERSGEDVAAALGLQRGYVDVLVHRAKAELRVCMRHSDGATAGLVKRSRPRNPGAERGAG